MKELKISEFADVVTGGTPSTSVKEFWENGNIPWLNSGELNKGYIYNAENFITETGLKNSSTKMMPVNTVLIALTGATCGLSAISKIEACANQSVTGILPSKNHVPEYLFHFLRTQRQRILDKAWGNAQPHISQAFVKDFKIPLPPLPTQLHIANLLSKAENLIAQRKESIRLLDEFLKSTFLEMFGEIKGEKVPLSTACILNPKKSEISEIDKTIEVSFVPMANVSEKGEVNLSQTRTLESVWNGFTYFREDDVVFAKITPCMENGKGAIMRNLKNKIGFGTTEFHVLRPIKDVSTAEWIYHLTMQYSFRKKAEQNMSGSAGQKRVPTDYFDKVKIVIPPIELQTQFAQIVEKTEALKTQYLQSLQELENLYGSLSQKAFRGELGLKDDSLLSSAEHGRSLAAEPINEYKTNV